MEMRRQVVDEDKRKKKLSYRGEICQAFVFTAFITLRILYILHFY